MQQQSGPNHAVRSTIRPTNRTVFVGISRMTKTKGRSTVTSIISGGGPIRAVGTVTDEAAAASVRSSLTETNALWTTSAMNRSWLPVIPEKSALP